MAKQAQPRRGKKGQVPMQTETITDLDQPVVDIEEDGRWVRLSFANGVTLRVPATDDRPAAAPRKSRPRPNRTTT